MMTPDERRAVMTTNPPEIDTIFDGHAYFNWAWKGCGFGQLSFEVDRKTQQITCMNECMSREMVRAILISFANHVADNCVMDCDREAEELAAQQRATDQGDPQ
jgi:hypothetical protein